MKKLYLILTSFLLAPIFFPLQSVAAQNDDLTIVTSFYPMYALTTEIVGDKHPVYMINSGKGIHGFEPSAADLAAIYDADLFVYHSPILESWTKNLETNKGNSEVQLLEAGKDLDLLKVPGLEDVAPIEGQSNENLFDPHSWLDPRLAAQEAQTIADSLSEIDPENANYYQENAKEFTEDAQELFQEFQENFVGVTNKTFVTQHTAFYYLAQAFGLSQFGVTGISSEQEPSAKQLNEVIKYVKETGVKAIFVEPNVSDRIAQVIASSTGVEVLSLSPLESDPQNDEDYLDNLEEVLETLYEHMK